MREADVEAVSERVKKGEAVLLALIVADPDTRLLLDDEKLFSALLEEKRETLVTAVDETVGTSDLSAVIVLDAIVVDEGIVEALPFEDTVGECVGDTVGDADWVTDREALEFPEVEGRRLVTVEALALPVADGLRDDTPMVRVGRVDTVVVAETVKTPLLLAVALGWGVAEIVDAPVGAVVVEPDIEGAALSVPASVGVRVGIDGLPVGLNVELLKGVCVTLIETLDVAVRLSREEVLARGVTLCAAVEFVDVEGAAGRVGVSEKRGEELTVCVEVGSALPLPLATREREVRGVSVVDIESEAQAEPELD